MTRAGLAGWLMYCNGHGAIHVSRCLLRKHTGSQRDAVHLQTLVRLPGRLVEAALLVGGGKAVILAYGSDTDWRPATAVQTLRECPTSRGWSTGWVFVCRGGKFESPDPAVRDSYNLMGAVARVG